MATTHDVPAGQGEPLSYPDSVVRDVVTTPEGVRLSSFAFGRADGPSVVFIMPVGLEARIVAPLANALGKTYRFITWETRLAPGADGALGETSCEVSSHLSDLEAVLDHYGLRGPVPLFSWCSSTQIALRFARERPERVASLIVVSPYLRGVIEESERRARNRKIYDRVVRRPGIADALVNEMQQTSALPDALMEEYQTTRLEIAEMVASPLLCAESLRRYASVMNALERIEPVDLAYQLEKPMLVVTGLRDRLASPDIARGIAERQGARVLTDPDCDHYIPVTPHRVLGGIESFLRETTAASVGYEQPQAAAV